MPPRFSARLSVNSKNTSIHATFRCLLLQLFLLRNFVISYTTAKLQNFTPAHLFKFDLDFCLTTCRYSRRRASKAVMSKMSTELNWKARRTHMHTQTGLSFHLIWLVPCPQAVCQMEGNLCKGWTCPDKQSDWNNTAPSRVGWPHLGAEEWLPEGEQGSSWDGVIVFLDFCLSDVRFRRRCEREKNVDVWRRLWAFVTLLTFTLTSAPQRVTTTDLVNLFLSPHNHPSPFLVLSSSLLSSLCSSICNICLWPGVFLLSLLLFLFSCMILSLHLCLFLLSQ